MKKILKITGIVLLALLLLLLILPFAFQGKIKDIAIKEVNKQLNAEVYVPDLSLSFFKNFPHASVTIKNFGVKGVDEFAGDTLANVEKLVLVLNIKSLFGDAYEINKVELDNGKIYAKVLENGKANWDIMKESEENEQDTTASGPFKVSLEKLKIRNLNVVYNDQQAQMFASVNGLNLTLSGDIAQGGEKDMNMGSLANIKELKLDIAKVQYADKTAGMAASLDTLGIDFTGSVSGQSAKLKTNVGVKELSFLMNKVSFLSKASINANIDMDLDMKTNTYTFRENQLQLNQIQANFDGFVQLVDSTTYNMDIRLNTPQIDFKQILSLIPAIYAKDFESVQTDGKVSLAANAKGTMHGEDLPSFDVKLNIANAMFKYPNLPSAVTGINIDAEAENPGGKADLTVINIPKFAFNMANNPFEAHLVLKTPISDPNFDFGAKGTVDFSKLKEVIPLENAELQGVLTADLTASGLYSYVEKEAYDKFNVAGNLNLTGFVFKSSDMPYDVKVNDARLNFATSYIDLASLQVMLGKNDISAKGRIENFLPYIMKDETIKGKLSVNSNYLNLNDFMSSEPDTAKADSTSLTVIQIPKNIDFGLDVNVNKLIYDNMELDSSKGSVTVKDQILNIQNLSSNTMGGSLGLKGNYNVQDTLRPTVNLDFDMKGMVISEVFTKIETLHSFAPVLADAGGNFSMQLDNFSAMLGQDMMPDLKTVSGKGKFSSKEVSVQNVKVLDQLADKLNYQSLKDPKIKDLSLNFEIKDGRLATEPFKTNVAGADMEIKGSSGLDQTLDYTTTIVIPNVKVPTIPLKFDVLIGGTFTSPTIGVSAKSTVGAVTDAIKGEVKKVVDDAKEKAAAAAKAAGQKLMDEAQKQADAIRSAAAKSADQVTAEAQKQSDALVAGAKNPIEKVAKQKAGQTLVKEAQKQSDKLKSDADTQANNIISSAQKQADKLIQDAENK